MLADRLKDLRSEKRLTQDDIAKHFGIAKTTYASYEQGRREPDYTLLANLAKFFDVSTDYLLGNSDKRHYYSLTEKDDKAIDAELERIIGGLTDKSGVSFLKNDATLSDNDRDLLAASLRSSLALAHEMAKKKFTPKKYRGSEKDAD